jgi:NADPH:quinone reductase-like Zn-dependent oxidoreductase
VRAGRGKLAAYKYASPKAPVAQQMEQERKRCHAKRQRPNGKRLAELARLVDAEQLKVHLDHFFSPEEAGQAHERLEERHNRSEIVLSVAGSPS